MARAAPLGGLTPRRASSAIGEPTKVVPTPRLGPGESNGNLGRPEVLPTPASAQEVRADAAYRKLIFQTSAEGTQEKSFDQAGDTIWIGEVTGRRKFYLRCDQYPFVPIQEGMTISRRFGRLTVRSDDRIPVPAGLGQSRVTLYTSWGRMVDTSEAPIGLDGGMICGSGTATTNPDSVFASLVAGNQHPTPGKGGGILKLKNTDLLNDLWVTYGDPVAVAAIVVANAYPIGAGQTENFDLRSLIHRPEVSILAGTVSGTCGFAFIVSSGSYDLADPSQVAGVILE